LKHKEHNEVIKYELYQCLMLTKFKMPRWTFSTIFQILKMQNVWFLLKWFWKSLLKLITLCGKYYKFMYCCLHLFILYLGRTLSVNWKTLFLIDSCTKVLQNKNLNRELCFDQKLFNGRKKLEHPCHGMHIILCMCVVMYVCIYCFVLESCRLPGV
jgi:hypothetical protein